MVQNMGEREKNNVLKEGPMYLYLQYFSHCCTKRGQKCFGSQFGKLNITFHTGWKLWYPWTHSLLFILWVKVTTTYSCHKSVNTVSPICVHLKGYKGSVVWTAFSSTKQNLAPGQGAMDDWLLCGILWWVEVLFTGEFLPVLRVL